jgi:hypothetical protein
MGQDLFYPPNVGGWSEGRAWLGSRNVVARANFASALAAGQLWHPAREPDLAHLLQRHGADASQKAGAEWLMMLLWGKSNSSMIEPLAASAMPLGSSRPWSKFVAHLMAQPEHHLA